MLSNAFVLIYCSAQPQRKYQNHNAYLRRRDNAISCVIPDLPPSVSVYAHSFLRATDLFNKNYHNTDIPSQWALGLGTSPYSDLLKPTSSLSDLSLIFSGNILDLRHSINGTQLRALEGDGQARFQESKDERTFERVTRETLAEVKERKAYYLCLEARAEELGINEWMETVVDVSLEWGARALFVMCAELESRSLGIRRYQQLYSEGKLAWQCVNVCRLV